MRNLRRSTCLAVEAPAETVLKALFPPPPPPPGRATPLPLTLPRLPCAQAEAERRRAAGFQEDLKNLKEQHFQIQKQVEQEEEYITNKLTKRLNQLKKEKQTLANEVEQEEEFLVRHADSCRDGILAAHCKHSS